MRHFILVLFLLLGLASPAVAQDPFAAALPGLGGNFNQTAEAVDRLGATGDPRALPVLRALSDGRLLRRPDGTLLLRDGAATTEVLTGAAADPAGAEAIRLNNRVRVSLRGALGRCRSSPRIRPSGSPPPRACSARGAPRTCRCWKPRWRARRCRASARRWSSPSPPPA